jgi:hypothetical protein
MKPARLRIVRDNETEKVFGSPRFVGLTRKPGLPSPHRFEPTVKRAGDVVIGLRARAATIKGE